MLQLYVGFLLQYFQIRSSNKNITAINANMGVVKGVAHIFSTPQPPFLKFLDDATGGDNLGKTVAKWMHSL